MPVFTGTPNDDVIFDSDGNDTVRGGAGNDQLVSGAGDDVLYGEGGDDNLTSGYGSDSLYGGYGNDSLWAYRGWGDFLSTIRLDGGAHDDYIAWETNSDARITAIGGTGNDYISGRGRYGAATINAGDGNDQVYLSLEGMSYSVTLGAGTDILSLSYSSSIWHLDGKLTVRDFQAGTGGDQVDLREFLTSFLPDWDGRQNLFATGTLALVQSGTDTLLQYTYYADADAPYTLIRFSNTAATDFNAYNLGWSPNGSAPAGVVWDATADSDYYEGTGGNDRLNGLGGDDYLYGYSGDDVIFGGAGNDVIHAGLGDDVVRGDSGNDHLNDNDGGSDRIYGSTGNDELSAYRDFHFTGSSILLDGGADDDNITVGVFNRSAVTILGGTGNDTAFIATNGPTRIDMGEGDEILTLNGDVYGGETTITLGLGADVLAFSPQSSVYAPTLWATVTDFTLGRGGDRIDLTSLLQRPYISSPTGNPFLRGPFQLVRAGNDALLQVDQGYGQGFATIIRLQGVDIGDFTDSYNLGFDSGTRDVFGTAAGEELRGLFGSNRMYGYAGDDRLYGFGGDDYL